MSKRQLYKMNRKAHPERCKSDFKAMSKKQLHNALLCRILYLNAAEYGVFHEAHHIKVQRDRKNAEIDEQINATLIKD